MLLVYTLTIFVGATLLFLVQPMFARMLLPKLGGSPAVWNTAMVFYQAALLAGYAYAHFSIQLLRTRRQAALHLLVLALPLLALPIGLATNIAAPAQSDPVWWMLGLMATSIGLPFFVVSTTSPLLQRWFHATGHPAAADPYFLYAASNAGSLLALLAYPTLIEPNFSLAAQSRFWSAGYGVLFALTAVCGFLLWRATRHSSMLTTLRVEESEERTVAQRAETISLARRVRWVLLAFAPSSLMLSVTMYLTTDIAAVPLLWIIPLTLYLLTFILVFATRQWIPHALVQRFLLPLALVLLAVVLAAETSAPLLPIVALHLAAFFIVALACHGELARDRPAPAHLTEFYLWMSLGGVLGGAFNALLAPLVFKSVTEYPLVLVLAALLAMPAPEREGDWDSVLDFALPILAGLVCVLLIFALPSLGMPESRLRTAITFGAPALVALCCAMRPIRFGLALGAMLLASTLQSDKDENVVYAERSFFGIYRVVRVQTATGIYHRFVHGSTLHGLQSRDPSRLNEPITYYDRNGPFGQVMQSLENRQGENFDAVGVMGLGAGTAAAYARPGQRWTFYEIDPLVKAVAQDPRLFSFLRDCRAPHEIILGDGRLQLKAAPDARYDLLVLDAYSSDALPIHLITREALQLYARKLTSQGAMLFNISNRHLDLKPQMAALARSIGWFALSCDDLHVAKEKRDKGKTASQWVILARRKSDLGQLASNPDWQPPPVKAAVAPWTDNYSSLLSVFMWK